jgi:hypothetical protein
MEKSLLQWSIELSTTFVPVRRCLREFRSSCTPAAAAAVFILALSTAESFCNEPGLVCATVHMSFHHIDSNVPYMTPDRQTAITTKSKGMEASLKAENQVHKQGFYLLRRLHWHHLHRPVCASSNDRSWGVL